MTETRELVVPGISCEHCRAALTEEIGAVPGVESVEVDLESKRVVVRGEALADGALRTAVESAGYEAA